MKIIENNLDQVIGGGTSISGTVINAFTNVIRLLIESGKGVGSSIRRVAEGELCPLQ